MTEVPFRELPIYSYDYDADFPPPARAFKSALGAVDAVLFVTPEYNRSIPRGLKNAIDNYMDTSAPAVRSRASPASRARRANCPAGRARLQ
jgi:NAD(P)H-dependent FMN reductase